MASVLLSSLGSSVGNAFLPSLGGRLFSRLGSKAGTAIDKYLGITSSSEGKRLSSIRVSDSKYGGGIPLVFGQVRAEGNCIWASDLIETKHESSALGGKGGLISSSSSGTTYTYSLNCAIAIAEGEIGGILTIWGDTTVIYQNGVWTDGIIDSATIYKGTSTQQPDPLMQSAIGSDAVPAYRGIAYIVLENLQLKIFGNRLPSLTFEVLPANVDLSPAWCGSVNTAIRQSDWVARSAALDPIVLEGTSSRVSRVLVGGFTTGDGTLAFTAIDYDVTGSVPVENARATSASFAYSSFTDAAWALSTDGRFVAFYFQDSNASPSHRFVLYDTETGKFGTILTGAYVTDAFKQIYWLDALHFIVTDLSDTSRGVRLFARSGLSLIDLGFTDVWGAGTQTTRYPFFHSQFIPISGGVLQVMMDNLAYFTALYLKPIMWDHNQLTAGTGYCLVSGYSSTTASGPMGQLIETSDGEWTLVFSTSLDIHLTSFRPTASGFTTVRAWQRLINTNSAVNTSLFAVLYGNSLTLVHRYGTDNYYRLSEIALGDNAFTLSSEGLVVEGFEKPCKNFGAFLLDGTRLLLIGVAGSSYTLQQLAIIERCKSGDTLAHVVGTILERAGYASTDYDVTALSSEQITGYLLDDPAKAADALEPLQIYCPFDLVESGAVLKAVLHSNASKLSLPDSELRAASDGLGAVELRCERAQELDLPKEITVDYIDASRDYETGTQRARRLATQGAKSVAKLSLPIVCTATTAKQIAEVRLYKAWSERESASLFLSRKYLALDPGDVVSVKDRLMRVSDVTLKNGVIEAGGVFVPEEAISSATSADAGTLSAATTKTVGESQAFIMDLPLLRADDDQPGFYVGLCGNDGWTGGSLWRSADGVNYTDLARFQNAVIAGIATSVLADAGACCRDRQNTVTVQLVRGTLSSCAQADLLNGANAALLGDELIQFQNAVLTAPGLYTLSLLLRGRRGSEAKTSTHAVGERFVVLTSGAVQFLPCLLTDRGRSYAFRALSDGQTLGGAGDVAFSYGLNTIKPFSPCHVKGKRAGATGTDCVITWVRRARSNGDWVDYIDVPLDESAEGYEVEILNGTTVLRSFTGIATSTVTYTAAQQTADWGSAIPSSFTVAVYQIGTRYGRGDAVQAQI